MPQRPGGSPGGVKLELTDLRAVVALGKLKNESEASGASEQAACVRKGAAPPPSCPAVPAHCSDTPAGDVAQPSENAQGAAHHHRRRDSDDSFDIALQMTAEQFQNLTQILARMREQILLRRQLDVDEGGKRAEASSAWERFVDAVRTFATQAFRNTEDPGFRSVQQGWIMLPDSILRRWWDAVQLAALLWSLGWLAVWVEASLRQRVWHRDPGDWLWLVEYVMEPLVTVLYFLDMYVCCSTVATGEFDVLLTDRVVLLKRYLRGSFAIDFIGAVPMHLLAVLISGGDKLWAPLHANRLFRLYRARSFFADFHGQGRRVDARYVDLYFEVIPRVRLLFWMFVSLHLLALIKMLISFGFDGNESEIRGGYWRAFYWNWAMLSTAPVALGVSGWADYTWAAFMLLLSQAMQGIIVGKVSLLLLRDDIEGMNQGRLRDVLTVMRHYSVPLPLQNEVLSFHYYNMKENVGSSTTDMLRGLPEQMDAEIQLYIKLNLISRVPMFTGVGEDLRIILARMLREELAEPGAVVVRAGDVGNEMYFLAYGSAEVLVGPQMLAVATLSKGQFFGEIALLEDCLRTATIVAVTYCHLFVLDKPIFAYVLNSFPDFRDRLRREIQSRQRTAAPAPPVPSPDQGDDSCPLSAPGRPLGESATPSPTASAIMDPSQFHQLALNGRNVRFDVRDAGERTVGYSPPGLDSAAGYNLPGVDHHSARRGPCQSKDSSENRDRPASGLTAHSGGSGPGRQTGLPGLLPVEPVNEQRAAPVRAPIVRALSRRNVFGTTASIESPSSTARAVAGSQVVSRPPAEGTPEPASPLSPYTRQYQKAGYESRGPSGTLGAFASAKYSSGISAALDAAINELVPQGGSGPVQSKDSSRSQAPESQRDATSPCATPDLMSGDQQRGSGRQDTPPRQHSHTSAAQSCEASVAPQSPPRLATEMVSEEADLPAGPLPSSADGAPEGGAAECRQQSVETAVLQLLDTTRACIERDADQLIGAAIGGFAARMDSVLSYHVKRAQDALREQTRHHHFQHRPGLLDHPVAAALAGHGTHPETRRVSALGFGGGSFTRRAQRTSIY